MRLCAWRHGVYGRGVVLACALTVGSFVTDFLAITDIIPGFSDVLLGKGLMISLAAFLLSSRLRPIRDARGCSTRVNSMHRSQ